MDKSAQVDTYQFYIPTYATKKSIAGTAYHRATEHEDGHDYDNLYLFNWGAQNQSNYLKIRLEGDIWLMEDRTYGVVNGYDRWYSTGSGIEWLARFMHVGDVVTQNVEIHVRETGTCRDFGPRVQAHQIKLADHRCQDLGGDLGIVELIEVQAPQANEGYLYGKGLGLLGFRPCMGCGWSVGEPGTHTPANTWSDVVSPHPQGCQPGK